jgi:hypothetical protein
VLGRTRLRSLAADRDQVLIRIATLERDLDGITGSIKHDRIAGPQQPPSQPPPQTQLQVPAPAPPPVAAASVAPIARAEAPAAPVLEATVTPAQAPAPQQAAASEAAQVTPPDARNRAAASPSGSSLVRVSAPVGPLATAAGLGVDVGGAVNYEGLRTLWRSIMNSDLVPLEEIYPVVAVRENGKTHGVDLRLIVGPIADAEAAERLCDSLAAAHHYCQPVAFEGQRLSLNEAAAPKAAPSHHSGARAPATVDPETPHFRAVIGK